ncbi:alkaline phosphatase D family protein [Variovorax terrae]|uniref:Alkaline phosphatase D family protein n=1 Tax=Variovorax terrae TaxID=2923278 RepID=A0A9X2AQB1_9BURK|nr:alkaline phosphatase D family protein [Variovorax terrae]MCJ0762981.1 alkaline phosphatase D family protein [Variovorax terrae]
MKPSSSLNLSTERRQFLQLAAAGAATLCLPRSAWSQPRFGGNPFTLGVASGSPTHDSVVLWTRLMAGDRPEAALADGRPVTVRWEVAHDERFSRIVHSGQAQALPELAHSVHVEVPALEPDRWYFYRFMVGEAASPVGRTRTFPAPDAPAQKLRLAYASCQRWEHGYFSAYRHMIQEDLDAVLFLGDYIYEYAGTSNPVRLPTGGWVITLDDYRQRYALHKGEAALQAMHAACPWLVTWDDHEVQNDYVGMEPGNSGPRVADFAARRAAAYQAYYEHMPLRAAVLTQAMAGLAGGAEMRIYGSTRFGRLATLYRLDARQYRDRQACTPGGRPGSATLNPETCALWNDPRRTFLGAAQEQWLDAALAQAGPGWNVLGQQTLLGRRDFRTGPGQSLWNDGWDGYPAARTRLTDSLRRHAVANTVVLSGDVHENWVGHVKADFAEAASPSIGVEFCGTSITSRAGGAGKVPQVLAENPHFVFADAEHRGYGVVEFTPQRVSTTLRAVDDVRLPDSGIHTLARFEVQAGRPVVERA